LNQEAWEEANLQQQCRPEGKYRLKKDKTSDNNEERSGKLI